MKRAPLFVISLSLATVAMALALVSAAQAADYRAPRTRLGQPDLQGIWTNTSVTMLQRPPMFKSLTLTDAEAAVMEAGFAKMVGDLISTDPIDPTLGAPPEVKEVGNSDFIEMDMKLARMGGQARSSWIIEPADGRLPFTDAAKAASKAAQARAGQAFDNPEARPNEDRCLTAIGSPEGPPMMNTAFNGHYQIIQTKDHVAIQVEMNHDVRIIRLGDRSHPPASVQPWMGDSVGWWEGETLVVETTNLRAGSSVSSLGGGFKWSGQGKVIERFTRTGKDALHYAFTVEDPVTFTAPWRGEMPMRAARGPIYEYACHEGNYSMANILSGAREIEKRAP